MTNKIVREVNMPVHFPPLFKHVGIYCRVSSGLREQLNSLAGQVSGLVQMVAQRYDMRLVDVYLDVMSGDSGERAEFNRMLEDARNRKIDIVLTKSISRFGRNTEDCVRALRELKDSQVQVIFVEEKIDTFKDPSELMVSIMAAFAEADNNSRRENQLWAIKKRLEDGTSEIYSRICYGYKKNKDGLISIDHDQAEVVQLIYSEYLGGSSIIGIQKKLREEGVVSARGNEIWSKRSIETILKNEKYTGSVIARKTITSAKKGHHRVKNTTENMYLASNIFPAIITKEIYDEVQEEIKRRTNIEIDETGTHRKGSHYSSKKENKQ